ncbi:hypothetical protein C4K00_2051 [Pseudomonas synxantha]|nr:hypothetical protein C4K00_2051 [Pseudomonas synxantha]
MQILHGDRASYSSKVERFDGEVAVTNTRVMELSMRAEGMLWLYGRAFSMGEGVRTGWFP